MQLKELILFKNVVFDNFINTWDWKVLESKVFSTNQSTMGCGEVTQRQITNIISMYLEIL